MERRILSISIFDTPGHANFCDRSFPAAARISDGILIVVDAAERGMCGTEKATEIKPRERTCLAFCSLTKLIDSS